MKRSGIYDVDKMEGRQFELYLGLLFKTLGYKTKVTRSAGDYGADLVIEKDEESVQSYKPNDKVKMSVLRLFNRFTDQKHIIMRNRRG